MFTNNKLRGNVMDLLERKGLEMEEEQKRKSFEMLVQMFDELVQENNLSREEQSFVALAINETLNIGFDFSNINLIENGN